MCTPNKKYFLFIFLLLIESMPIYAAENLEGKDLIKYECKNLERNNHKSLRCIYSKYLKDNKIDSIIKYLDSFPNVYKKLEIEDQKYSDNFSKRGWISYHVFDSLFCHGLQNCNKKVIAKFFEYLSKSDGYFSTNFSAIFYDHLINDKDLIIRNIKTLNKHINRQLVCKLEPDPEYNLNIKKIASEYYKICGKNCKVSDIIRVFIGRTSGLKCRSK